MTRLLVLAAVVSLLTGCGEDQSAVPGEAALVSQVESSKVGYDTDQWLMMRGIHGDWQKVGLIFGYVNDREECEKALAGLAKANEAREYICMPAEQR